MKQISTLAFGMLLFLNVSAQLENEDFPDFTHTDIEGTEHTLYDYLDEGKIVIIDIFTTWCPNCVSSLPALDEILEDHGPDGDGSIVLLSFERDASTTNEAEWAANNNVVNPIFADGIESIEAWGTVYQPNYFVICPDRTYELVVGGIGSNASALLDLSDQCGAFVGVEETNQDPFTILGNSVSENVRVNFHGNSNATFQIINLGGQLQKEGVLYPGNSVINVSELMSGIYFLRLTDGESILTERLVIR